MAEPGQDRRPGALPRFAFGALSVLVGAYAAWRLGELRRAREADALAGGPGPARPGAKRKK